MSRALAHTRWAMRTSARVSLGKMHYDQQRIKMCDQLGVDRPGSTGVSGLGITNAVLHALKGTQPFVQALSGVKPLPRLHTGLRGAPSHFARSGSNFAAVVMDVRQEDEITRKLRENQRVVVKIRAKFEH